MKTKSKIRKAFSTTGWVLIGLLLFVSAWGFVDKLTGYNFSFLGVRTSYITSESMATVHEDNEEYLAGIEDRYYVNDLIIVKVVRDPTKIKEFDVVLFYSHQYERLITHRVISVFHDEEKGNYFLHTRGDANNVDDPLVHFNDVKGVVVRRVAEVGNIFGFINSPYGLFAFTTVGAIFFGGWFISDVLEERQKKKEQNSE